MLKVGYRFISPAALHVGSGGGGPPPASTWDAASAGTDAILSSGNTIFTAGTSWTTARGSKGYISGKHYFEVKLIAYDGNLPVMVGIGDAASSGAANDAYNPANGIAVRTDTLFSGGTGFSGTGNAVGLGALSPNDIIGVALDLDNSKCWVSVNNTWKGTGTQDPGSNSANWFYNFPAATTLYPRASCYTTGTAQLITGTTTYTPPSGFTAWE